MRRGVDDVFLITQLTYPASIRKLAGHMGYIPSKADVDCNLFTDSLVCFVFAYGVTKGLIRCDESLYSVFSSNFWRPVVLFLGIGLPASPRVPAGKCEAVVSSDSSTRRCTWTVRNPRSNSRKQMLPPTWHRRVPPGFPSLAKPPPFSAIALAPQWQLDWRQ